MRKKVPPAMWGLAVFLLAARFRRIYIILKYVCIIAYMFDFVKNIIERAFYARIRLCLKSFVFHHHINIVIIICVLCESDVKTHFRFFFDELCFLPRPVLLFTFSCSRSFSVSARTSLFGSFFFVKAPMIFTNSHRINASIK